MTVHPKVLVIGLDAAEKDLVLAWARSGHHKPHGLVLAAGPGIRPQQIGEPVSIMDVAPTIAAILGVLLPDIDGRAIAACIGDRR